MHIDRRGPLDLSETKAAEPNHGPILWRWCAQM